MRTSCRASLVSGCWSLLMAGLETTMGNRLCIKDSTCVHVLICHLNLHLLNIE